MRREGFELLVSRPKVIYKEIDGLYPADGYPAWNEARDQLIFIKNEQYKQDINWGNWNA